MFILLALRNEGRNEGLAANSTSIAKSVPVSDLCVLCGSAFSSLSCVCPVGTGGRLFSAIRPHLSILSSLFRTKRPKLNPLFSYSSALFAQECFHNSFPINSFRTLLQNTGGWGCTPYACFSTPVPAASRETFFLPPGCSPQVQENLDATSRPSRLRPSSLNIPTGTASSPRADHISTTESPLCPRKRSTSPH